MKLPTILSSTPLLLSLLAILPTTHAENKTCYFLDGSVATADVPCTSDATTNCCNKADICMSNGLCYLQGSHGMALSRGSCTDKSWGARCFAPCSSSNRNNGFPVINVGFSGKDSQYCCGSVTVKDGKTTCTSEGDPFTITMGTAIPGVAGLSVSNNNNNNSNSDSGSGSGSTNNTDSTCDDQRLKEKALDNHDIAIGVGVGVPLGLIAVASIAWALYERRQRRGAGGGVVGEKAEGGGGGYVGLYGDGNMGTPSMGGSMNMNHGGTPLVELNTTTASTQRPVELDSGKVQR
ncbi:hypothetical protein BDV27DRAFT_169398 [Aspergillus caelatus]|uniref:Mid2 domain-containing protein n=1 Tax=Aspergillus caelatus TaxID=61420 RepID=A0A5N6ZLH1_9EURO|nr:uncharacterized protein BDV27DRAFT_169398 [Aspergillus caelatus]KAE8358472.1 hypothetical protein BDV27DRAFT_169398 [Aspergillus caelatus]